jgi:hypothetical protein
MKRVAATALLAIGLLHGAAAVSQDGRGDRPGGSGNAAQAASEKARAEAARQLKAQPGEFTVVAIEPTQWSDASLGCRKPGTTSAQVVTNGYVIVLERQGQRHQVNVAGSHAVMCEGASRITASGRGQTSARGLDRVAALARQDLANKLRLDAQHIRVVKTEPRHWTDDDMNCNSGGGSAAAAGSAAEATAQSSFGYRMELSASGRTYYYHTDLRSVRACPPTQ